MLLEVISESDDVLSIDLEDPDVFKEFNSIFIGAMAQQYAKDSDIIRTSEYNWHFFVYQKDSKLR